MAVDSHAVDRYAVVGNPVQHSQSPVIHAAFARQTGHSLSYTKIFSPEDAFQAAVADFQAAGGRGLNITLPFKEQALQLAAAASTRAQAAGAANTLKFDGQTIFADMTDGVGFVRDYCGNLKGTIAGRKVLILGAGGAVRGILGEILAAQPDEVIIANRNLDRAHAVAANCGLGPTAVLGYQALGDKRFDLIINGTAASLKGALPPLPENLLLPAGHCYDLVYAREPTAFMRWASQCGAQLVADGLGMLVEQAAESFYLWRGVRPLTQPVIAALRGS